MTIQITVGVWQEMTYANALRQLGALVFDPSVAYSIVALTSKISIHMPVSLRSNNAEDSDSADVDLEAAGRRYSFRTTVLESGEIETAYIVRRAA
jgi:hypothetical protein